MQVASTRSYRRHIRSAFGEVAILIVNLIAVRADWSDDWQIFTPVSLTDFYRFLITSLASLFNFHRANWFASTCPRLLSRLHYSRQLALSVHTLNRRQWKSRIANFPEVQRLNGPCCSGQTLRVFLLLKASSHVPVKLIWLSGCQWKNWLLDSFQLKNCLGASDQ